MSKVLRNFAQDMGIGKLTIAGIPMVFGWTQDDGANNAGLADLISSEEDMIPPIARFASFLNPTDFAELFSHYPAADFEFDVANYEARRSESDPSVSVHFFRVARIMRDLLFTCSSIEFGFEMTRQTRLERNHWDGVRLYNLNQTMLTPLLNMGGMPYAGVIHGSDSNYMFNGQLLEIPIDEVDKKLSRELSPAFINFAYSGNAEGEGALGEWSSGFGSTADYESSPVLQKMSIEVVGGPHGSGSVPLENSNSITLQREDTIQQPIRDAEVQYAAMRSPAFGVKKAHLESERLFERCAYINSLAEKLGR